MKKKENAPFGADQMIRTLLEQFLIRLVRATDEQVSPATPQQERKSLVDDAKRYIKENLTSHVSVGELCLIFNTNKTTLSREFREAYGQTVIDYVNRKRIDYTKELLREGTHTLTDIADIMNMSSVHYLTALFKKLVGISPTEYIARHKHLIK
jgi:AraC-like DNA-binding protein